MTRLYLFLISVLLPVYLSAQSITTNPALPIDSKPVTITFDSSKESRLGYFTSDLYAHTGVILEGSSSWQHVIGTWGNNSVQPKLTNKGGGIYELTITPDIISYYSVLSTEKVKKLAFVFRSADASKQTNDLLVDVYTEGLNLSITSPSEINIFEKNESFLFSASATVGAELKLYLNKQEIASETGTSISRTVTIPDAGNYWLKAKAIQSSTIIVDSVYVCVRETTVDEGRPAGLPNGVNYIDEQSATLILYAPGKNHIFVTGDFNNWLPDNAYQMKKDGNYFWLTLENLVPGKEYVYQYLIDGALKVADPYTDKVSDPYDDQYISPTVYPDLIAYPDGKAEGRASILETGQPAYNWENTTYDIPSASQLVVYELLVRDFTNDGTYRAVQEKLEYLKKLGVNAIELMPFSEFEGNSSWGYNPNFYFAPDKAYGTKNDLKALIDECHRQGFVVIQDMVLNHAYGSCPLVKMYWDSANNRPAANNPWFNVSSPNTTYSWGYDFNHESQATKDFVDQVTRYWLTEYRVDGFRFDFTKGFTNTPGDGSGYDASRIAILERMADKIWAVNPKAFVILEHFAANTEEQELAAYKNGMLVWGNANYNFNEATMGYNDGGNSNFSWASYQMRGYSKPGLVAYMESHDEERLMYKNRMYGNSSGSYNIKNLNTALNRNEMAATFFLSLAGPKMIWQFGELGYDYSINRCENGSVSSDCRTSPKPVVWDYYEDSVRLRLFSVYTGMLHLRQEFPVFTDGAESLDVSGSVKKIKLEYGNHHILVLGNFGVTQTTIDPAFQHTGDWYEYFSGAKKTVTNTSEQMTLQPGEYRLYSDVELPPYKDFSTAAPAWQKLISPLIVFPNPASSGITVKMPIGASEVRLFSPEGRLLKTCGASNESQVQVDLSGYVPGIYVIQVRSEAGLFSQKLIKY
jgi:glycosidase